MFKLLYMLFLFFNLITFTLNVNTFNNNNNNDNNKIKLPNVNNKYYTKISFPFIGNQEIEYLQYKKYKSKITLKGIINENGFVTYDIKELDKLKNLSRKEGSTKIIIDFSEGDKSYVFELKEKRKIDHNLLNSLNMAQNIK